MPFSNLLIEGLAVISTFTALTGPYWMKPLQLARSVQPWALAVPWVGNRRAPEDQNPDTGWSISLM
jgi:hypothetical protein